MTLHELFDRIFPLERRWLGLFLLVSFFLHGVCFLILQLRPLSARDLPRSPGQVFLLSGFPADSSWARSLELNDPTVLAVPRLEELEPSFADSWVGNADWLFPPERISLEEPSEAQDLDYPLRRGAMTLGPLRPRAAPLPPALGGSRVEIHGLLQKRQVLQMPNWPRPQVRADLRTTRIHFAVDEWGLVDQAFLEESSGKVDVDHLGIQTLHRMLFKPGTEGLEWGWLTIYWDPLVEWVGETP